jgi:hypothetical protein
MSLDNVLGVAAAAKGSLLLLILGLAISIPLIIYGSTFILKLMNRFPSIITIGGGVLGWVAGEMAIADPIVSPWVESNADWLHSMAPVIGALSVVAVGKSIAARKIAAPEPARARAAEEEPPPGYRWVHRPWRKLPDGTREYAASYGKAAFKVLLPVSSKVRSHRH